MPTPPHHQFADLPEVESELFYPTFWQNFVVNVQIIIRDGDRSRSNPPASPLFKFQAQPLVESSNVMADVNNNKGSQYKELH